MNFLDLPLTDDEKGDFIFYFSSVLKNGLPSIIKGRKKEDRYKLFNRYVPLVKNLVSVLESYKNEYGDVTKEKARIGELNQIKRDAGLTFPFVYSKSLSIVEGSIQFLNNFETAFNNFIGANPSLSPTYVPVSATPTTPAPTPTAPTPTSGLVSTPATTTAGRTLVAYDFCTGILSEDPGVKDDFYNYWVARQLSWQPGITDQNILIGQVATRYTQIVDYMKEFDNATNPTEKKRIQNEILALNRDSFFVDESNKSLRGYDQSVLDEIDSFLAAMET
jgi:hypothetical protein